MAVNYLNQVKSREEYRKMKEEETKKVEVVRPQRKKLRVRLIPIWLRLVLLIVFSFIFLMAGAAFGYGTLGKGKATDVFKLSTWTHIGDLVNKK
ncbi:DNA-directed RNA polymerase subunit beta [Neobacillus massiliamazoniensis]|jgi:lipopolysaccharide/colanic/teichoic acid biosynthesis glycosyltransferase|uniref:DNA-directed RNA polymerase subunit beta n=1 Tax=Neobacillus massiliamazoniensis TaxID=1499688 RepID=A0A0U1NXB3_9BACI|nr:DNA-directed RNA polymerase subunit beta [Neobacillus massiliamazoniensis]CRK82667.1 DNA-directed RNA polymerase subunit beta [Neobacillus massiliamazoniensis]